MSAYRSVRVTRKPIDSEIRQMRDQGLSLRCADLCGRNVECILGRPVAPGDEHIQFDQPVSPRVPGGAGEAGDQGFLSRDITVRA